MAIDQVDCFSGVQVLDMHVELKMIMLVDYIHRCRRHLPYVCLFVRTNKPLTLGIMPNPALYQGEVSVFISHHNTNFGIFLGIGMVGRQLFWSTSPENGPKSK